MTKQRTNQDRVFGERPALHPDVGLRQLMWAESSRIQSTCFIGIFCDISGFYDSVEWQSVIAEGLRLSFPPLLLELALQIYSGYRSLSAENSVAPGILPCSGLLQGVFWPSISKLALFAPIKQIMEGQLAHHVDQWLDDISADITGRCITDLAKDLGIDSDAGRRRRLATFLSRQKKASARNGRLHKLRAPGSKARVRLVRGSVLTSGLYGHQAQGVSPKHLKWCRL